MGGAVLTNGRSWVRPRTGAWPTPNSGVLTPAAVCFYNRAMAENIDEITINYEEDGLLVVEELDRVVLSRGAWTTILFLFRERERQTGEFGPPKAGLRRYQKFRGEFRKRDAINLSPKSAALLLETLPRWFEELAPKP